MPEEKGLFQRLFDKSGDELERLEGTPAPAEPTEPTESDAERAERERIEERIRKFRAGEDPDKDARNASLLGDGEFDEFALDYDPALHHLQGNAEASLEEENQMKQVVQGSTDVVFGDAMPQTLNAIRTQPELYMGISDVAYEILKAEKAKMDGKGEEVHPSVFFAETGAAPVIIDQLWSLAEAADLEGSRDKDQYSGALINLYRRMGEHIIEEGDENAIIEAEELAINMALTNEDGSFMEDPDSGDSAQRNNIERNRLAQGIGTALLGEQV
jgi:hypothetical protein